MSPVCMPDYVRCRKKTDTKFGEVGSGKGEARSAERRCGARRRPTEFELLRTRSGCQQTIHVEIADGILHRLIEKSGCPRMAASPFPVFCVSIDKREHGSILVSPAGNVVP